jgi:hypothetical protein
MENVDAEWEKFISNFQSKTDMNEFIFSEKEEILVSDENATDIPLPETIYIRNECESLYISTQTKIFYLNVNSLDVDTIFWNLEVMEYGIPRMGIIKKQMRMIFKSPEEYTVYAEKIQKIPYYTENIIKQINNPNARKLKFKDERKLTVGISKKDIMNCHGKEKKAFINCFAIILRIPCILSSKNGKENETTFHEVHVKVFNTGKITIPGIVDDNDSLLEITKNYILEILQASVSTPLALIPEDEIPLLKKVVKNKKGVLSAESFYYREEGEDNDIDELDRGEEDRDKGENDYVRDKKKKLRLPKNSHIEYVKQQSGVLINSNFNCGFYIDQMKLMTVLQEKYHLEPTYNKSNYPGVKCKFYLNNELPLDISVQSGKISEEDKKNRINEWHLENKYTKITFVIFRTGNNLILGNFSKTVLLFIFEFVKRILLTEYEEIRTYHEEITKIAKKIKPRKKKVVFTRDYFLGLSGTTSSSFSN